MIRSSIIENAYFSSSHDGDIKKVLKEIKSDANFAEMKQTHSSEVKIINNCLLYTSPSPRDGLLSRMPSSA